MNCQKSMMRILGNEGHQAQKLDLCLEELRSKTRPLAAEGASGRGRTMVLLTPSRLHQCQPSMAASQWPEWTPLKVDKLDHFRAALAKTSAWQASILIRSLELSRGS